MTNIKNASCPAAWGPLLRGGGARLAAADVRVGAFRNVVNCILPRSTWKVRTPAEYRQQHGEVAHSVTAVYPNIQKPHKRD